MHHSTITQFNFGPFAVACLVKSSLDLPIPVTAASNRNRYSHFSPPRCVGCVDLGVNVSLLLQLLRTQYCEVEVAVVVTVNNITVVMTIRQYQ